METSRLLIREMTLEDLDALYEIYDHEVIRYVEGLYENRLEEEEFTEAYIRNMYGFYGYGIWILQLKDGRIIGRAGISNREIDNGMTLEIGYVLGSRYWRQGYATEAVTAIMEYAFEELEAEDISCFIKPDNIPSANLAKKLGFENLGIVCCEKEKYVRYVKYREKRKD